MNHRKELLKSLWVDLINPKPYTLSPKPYNPEPVNPTTLPEWKILNPAW